MAKLIVFKGLPASGKSTKAKELLKEDGNAIRLNKDLLRKMLHFDRFSGPNEESTMQAETDLADYFLTRGKNVIIDDTNLNPRVFNSWKELAKSQSYKFEVIDMDTDYKECIARDAIRTDTVGRDVIIGMARQYGLYRAEKRDIICDIDGTLCDISHRLHFVKDSNNQINFDKLENKKDWKSFFENIDKDEPRQEIIDKVKELSKTHTINLVSGRPEEYKLQTIEWLRKYNVPYDYLLMRRKGDKRVDDIVKKEFLDKYFDKSNIDLVIDDRPRVIRMWRAEGLKVEDVGGGLEF